MKLTNKSDIAAELHSIGNIDIFLCCSSFEERCLSLPRLMEDIRISKSLVCFNSNETGKIAENASILKSLLPNSEIVELHSSKPVSLANNFRQAFSDALNATGKKSGINIFIDSTTFTHEGLCIVFKFLLINKRFFNGIIVGYVGADEYSINEKNEADKWLSKGIGEVRSILGYPGLINPSRKNHLIILFGFESDRTAKIIEHLDFDNVSIGLGPISHSINEKHFKINYQRHLELLKTYQNAEKFEFCLTDPVLAQQQILAQVSKFPDHNVVIAPLNTKLSTIGAILAAQENLEIQLCYVQAKEYNVTGYSKPGDDIYLFSLY